MLIIGVVVGLALHALMYGPQAAYVTEQFPVLLRYAGSSVACRGDRKGHRAHRVHRPAAAMGQLVPLTLYLAAAIVVTLVGLGLGRDPQLDDETALVRKHSMR